MSVRSTFGFLVLFVLGCGPAPEIATARQALGGAPPTCPPLTEPDQSGKCVLDGDIELTAPLMLESFTHLNCKGHRILPSSAGVDGPLGVYQPSVPEVGIALIGTRGVKVQNCVIGAPDRRIDFGVVIVASKSTQPGGSEGNKIQSNELHVRALAVEVLASDENLISENSIEWDGSGVGIFIGRDADRTQTLHNTLTSSSRPPSYVRMFPGMQAVLPIADAGIFHGDPPAIFPLYSLIIGGRLVQLPDFGLPRLEDSLCEGNSVSLPGPHTGKSHAGLYAAVMSSRTIMRGNTVVGGRPGIRHAGERINTPVQFPERCSGDQGRYCVTTADCKLLGVDVGTCPPLAPAVLSDARAVDPINEGNTLIGPFGDPGGIDVLDTAIGPFGGTVGAVVRDNRVLAAGSSFGIVLSGDGIRDTLTLLPGSGATITRNVIDGARVALSFALRQNPPTFFGANISRNDIINSSVFAAAGFEATYALPTELSVAGVGNYWGHAAAPGFVPSDSNNPVIVDHFPFCQPIAALADPLPATCP